MKNQFDDHDEFPSFLVSRHSYFDSDSGMTFDGKPSSQQNRISLVEKGSEFSFFPYPWLAFDNWAAAPHLYFCFHSNGVVLESISKEFGEKRDPEDEPIFVGVYLGKDVDISRFFNGHSPSKVVHLDSISPDQVWMHSNHRTESFALLESEEEVENWKRVIRLGKIVCDEVTPYRDDFTTPVFVLKEQLEANEKLLSSYRNLRAICANFYRCFPQAEVYRRYRSFSRDSRRR